MRSRHFASLLALALTSISAAASAQDFDAEGEEAMLARINALRVERQLAPLGRMPALDAVARAHSVEMASRGELAHVSQRTGTPEDRVRAAGVEAGAIAENVAMHRDAASAQQALVESAPHLGNMLRPDVTHVGIGVVRTERGGVWATQVFAAVAPPPPPVVATIVEPAEAEQPAAEPAEEPVVAAPALESAASIFQIIPPFVERALGAAGDAVGADEPEASVEAPARSAQPATPAALPPATAATLRQLVDLAQSLLGPPSGE